MKLWVITTSYPRRPDESINAGVLARDLALTLSDLGHDVSVIAPEKPGGIEFDASLTGRTIPWWRPTLAMADLSAKNPLHILSIASLFASAWKTLRSAARQDRPDGIIALWALPSGIFARWVHRWAKTPYVVWMLGSDVWKADKYPGGVRALRSCLEDANGAFADGRELADQAFRLTGVATEFVASARRFPAVERAVRHGENLLFVGRYHLNKGADVLLEALSKVVVTRPSVRLAMHGSGELQEYLHGMSERLGLTTNATIGPPLSADELAKAMSVADILVIPSRVDSIPLILGDAVQARVPVVATQTGDMGELVADLGIGLTAQPGDPDSLARAILQMLDERRERSFSQAQAYLTPDRAARIFELALTEGHP